MLKNISAFLLILLMSQTAILAQESQKEQVAQWNIERWIAENWKTDFSKTIIDLSEIINVIGADVIPSIDNPKFQPIAKETDIKGNEPVIAFAHNGVTRAYPLRYMMWHEIVNDVVGGLPVAVTYCPLCNSSVVFNRVIDGKAVTFGTTGKLRYSALVMYDRDEQNWWQQVTGEALVGAKAGEILETLTSILISYDLFKERYPKGEVLMADPRRASLSGQNPYVNYDSTKTPFLFVGDLPTDIEPMMRIALVTEPNPIAVTLPYLEKNTPFRLGDLEFTWQAGQASALDSARISEGRDVGNIEVFQILPDGSKVPTAYMVTFAFAGRAFYEGLEIIQE